MHWSPRKRLALSIGVLLVAVSAAVAGANGPARAATARPQAVAAYAGQASGQPRTALRLPGASLSGIAVLSAKNAWAGGYDNGGLLAHWNGVRWSYTVLKQIGGINAINAISPTDVWAVGGGAILHWNGHAWSLAKYPTITFLSVSATSADNVWAAGAYGSIIDPNPQDGEAALLHWTGRRWFVVPVQSPKGISLQEINSVAPTGPKSVWATAYVALSGGEYILLHWIGTVWRPVTTRTPSGTIGFVLANSVVAAPHDRAWVFGWTTAALLTPQIMYWNGKSWVIRSGPLGQQSGYSDACFEGNGTGWAVGNQDWGALMTGISRWTGKTWTPSPVRDTGTTQYGGYSLVACAALSNNDAWAVGTVSQTAEDYSSLIVHWNGKIWS